MVKYGLATSTVIAVILSYFWLNPKSNPSTAPVAISPEPNTTTPAMEVNVRQAEQQTLDNVNKEIALPHGDTLGIVIRDGSAYKKTRYIENVASELSSLKNDAENGDAIAAYLVSHSLERCEGADRNEAALEESIERLYQNRTILVRKYRDGAWRESIAALADDPDADLDQLAQELLREPHDSCAGITDNDVESASDWLQKSADLGHPVAAREYALTLPRSQKSLQYLEQSWRGGDVYSLAYAAKQYSDGWGDIPEMNRDPMNAYAYHLAYAVAMQGLSDDTRATNRRLDRLMTGAEKELEILKSRLSQNDIASGQRIAATILRDNPNCCFGL